MRGAASSLLSLVAASSLVNSVLSHPHTSVHSIALRDDSSTPYPVVGVPGDVQPRLEIRAMAAAEPEMYSLFLLAMEHFKANDDPVNGYYAISGVHGVPRMDWNGVGQCSDCQGADGYCAHNSVLFPAWHRAYVALLEQEFYKAAQQIAAQYTGAKSATMKDAAARIRLPYWDWAAVPAPNTPVMPAALTEKEITIDGPNGQQTISNPLYRYDFADPSNLVYSPFISWDNTLRHPDSDGASAVSDESDVVTTFQNQQPNLQDSVYQLLSTCGDYLEFSNDASAASSPSCANSLESIHNNVHTYLGGPQGNVSAGHMTYLPLAAFDPVFWMHHSNVDRIFALWQALHGDSYGASQVAGFSTWTIAKGSTQDADSPLKPFHKDTAGNFWTTNDVREWDTTFHYTYVEFANGGSKDAIAKAVNALYGPHAQYVAPASSNATTPSATASATSSVAATSSATSSATSAATSSARFSSFNHVVANTTSTSSSALAASTTAAPTTSSSGFNLGDLFPSAGASGGLQLGGLLPSIDVSGSLNLGGLLPSVSIGLSPLPSITLPNISFPSLSLPDLPVPTFPSTFTNNAGGVWQYVANVRYPRWELDGSYTIYLFNGAPSSENTGSFMLDSQLIGMVSALAGGSMSMSGVIASASVPLTRHLQNLVKSGELASMDEQVILPFLTAHLSWRVVGPRGEEVDVKDLPGFQVSCYSSTSSQNSTSTLPQWSSFVPQAGVTEQKAGGATIENIIKGAGDIVGDVGNIVGNVVGGISSLLTGDSGSDSESSSTVASDSYVASSAPVTASSYAASSSPVAASSYVAGSSAAAVSTPAEASSAPALSTAAPVCNGPKVTEYVTVTLTGSYAAQATAYRA